MPNSRARYGACGLPAVSRPKSLPPKFGARYETRPMAMRMKEMLRTMPRTLRLDGRGRLALHGLLAHRACHRRADDRGGADDERGHGLVDEHGAERDRDDRVDVRVRGDLR